MIVTKRKAGPCLVGRQPVVGAPSRMPYQPRIHEPGSLDPRVFDVTDGACYDLAKELQGNYGLYVDSDENELKSFTVYSFPIELRVELATLQAHTFKGSMPSFQSVLSVAVAHGLEALSNHPVVVLWAETQTALMRCDFVNYDHKAFTNEIAATARMEQVSYGSPIPKRNIRLPGEIMQGLYRYSGVWNLSASMLVVLSSLLTLSTQEAVHETQRPKMAEAVMSVLDRLLCRIKVLRFCIKEFTGEECE